MTRHANLTIPMMVFLMILAGATSAIAQDASSILKAVDQAGHVESGKMEVIQTIVTPSGDKRTFKMMTYSMNGNDKGLTVYLSPNQVKGMKILTLNDGDDIWSYFPRTNRVRKIASSARNRRVQGSDFTYDDMASGKMSTNWKGKVLKKEKLGDVNTTVLSLTPTKSGPTSYTKAVAWVDTARNVLLRMEYYDEDGELEKRLDLGDYKKIKGVMVPMRYTMTNLTDGGSTTMKVNKAAINLKLDETLFLDSTLAG